MNKNKWKTSYFCKNCNEEVCFWYITENSGKCSHCGYRAMYGASFYEMSCRNIAPWWKFWDKRKEYRMKRLS